MMKDKQPLTVLLLGLAGLTLLGWAIYAYLHPLIIISWSTATEFETAGYFIYRSLAPDGDYERINDGLIPSSGDAVSGADYSYTDRDVLPGFTYYYILEEVEMGGSTNREGPLEAMAERRGLVEAGMGLVLLGFAFLARRIFCASAEP